MEILGLILILVVVTAVVKITDLIKKNNRVKYELEGTKASEYSFKKAMRMAQEDKVRIANMNTELKGKITIQKEEISRLNKVCTKMRQNEETLTLLHSKELLIKEKEIEELKSRIKVLTAGEELLNAIEKNKPLQEQKRTYVRGELYGLMKAYFISKTSTYPVLTSMLKGRYRTSDSSLHYTLNNLVKNGIIHKIGHGTYMPVNKPLDNKPK